MMLSCKQAIRLQIDCRDLYQHLWKAAWTASHPELPFDSLAGTEAPLESGVNQPRILAGRIVVGDRLTWQTGTKARCVYAGADM
jgi:hypothetical protein